MLLLLLLLPALVDNPLLLPLPDDACACDEMHLAVAVVHPAV